MKTPLKFLLLCLTFAGIIYGSAASNEMLTTGTTIPPFSAKSVNGKLYSTSNLSNHPLTILYFFDVTSPSSQSGLFYLERLSRMYGSSGLHIWGITRSSSKRVSSFIDKHSPTFPVLLDTSTISRQYFASIILPTVCIVGPDNILLDYFQGGGDASQVMMMRLAERQLQRRQPQIAQAISDTIINTHPGNIKAQTLNGYAALKQGKIDTAQKIFTELTQTPSGVIIGKEGLSAVYATKGILQKALALANEVEQKAPERSFIHVIKGDILYGQNKTDEAFLEYRKAVRKNETAEVYQKALAYNQLGRLETERQNYKHARRLYDQAIEIDPYFIEATANKGLAYAKEANWQKALDSYHKALKRDGSDTFTQILARKAQEMLEIQKNAEQRNRINTLVHELTNRYHTQKKNTAENDDKWTSPPLTLAFVDFNEKGVLAQRDGIAMVLSSQLSEKLNQSKRVTVIERTVMDRLLEELNIGTSELADDDTALKLGRMLATRIIGTGSLIHMPATSLLNLRLIDTQTSKIIKVITREVSLNTLEKDLRRLNRNLLEIVMEAYPLQGYVVSSTTQNVIINIGANQGVVNGTCFEIFEDQPPVTYRGRLLKRRTKSVANIEITQVEPDLSFAKIIGQNRKPKSNDKIKEQIHAAMD